MFETMSWKMKWFLGIIAVVTFICIAAAVASAGDLDRRSFLRDDRIVFVPGTDEANAQVSDGNATVSLDWNGTQTFLRMEAEDGVTNWCYVNNSDTWTCTTSEP